MKLVGLSNEANNEIIQTGEYALAFGVADGTIIFMKGDIAYEM